MLSNENVLLVEALLCKLIVSSEFEKHFTKFDLKSWDQNSLINYLLRIGILVNIPYNVS